jgi:hypothetical protein
MKTISEEMKAKIYEANMIPWSGGRSAPADYDGGNVMFRDGTIGDDAAFGSDTSFIDAQWNWDYNDTDVNDIEIVAYTPRNPTKVVVNASSYAPVGKYTPHPQVTFTVEAILDMVPGAFYDPNDLMEWIASNPYVRMVKMEVPSQER